ncbi:hypothetical protein [Rhodohalobacter barkolensis]|uniref:Uncharacterized protein n=1 Tax=Rhodohalobacter barkolensis TaxID=2053187 RepID=A0A2N0VJ70_9BACT|nr:hypothetical protein [Rhodohalobacter barkolensis]PKD44240.1 hypothetical protein CWD77_01885 [Rhodohalobacter barkolensis]
MMEDFAVPGRPDEYWPEEFEPESRNDRERIKCNCFSEWDAFCDLVYRPDTDLMKPFEAINKHNLYREAGIRSYCVDTCSLIHLL